MISVEEQERRAGELFDRQADIQERITKLDNEIKLLEQEVVVVQPEVDLEKDVNGNDIAPAHTPATIEPIGELINLDTNVDYQQFEAPEWCIPIKANVMTFDWASLAKETQFDCILMYIFSQ
jgi:hypothetical protein